MLSSGAILAQAKPDVELRHSLVVEAPSGGISLADQYDIAVKDFKSAQGLDAHYSAARQAAAVRYTQGKLIAAQWWLRRAANYAPNRAAADLNRSDFQTIREQTGIRSSFEFNISPSSNINNGVRDRVIDIGDNFILVFPTSSLALSGIEYSAQADIEFKLSQGPRHQTAFDISLYGKTYSLSDDAKRLAPFAKGSDYAEKSAIVGLTHAVLLKPNWGISEARISAGEIYSDRDEIRWFKRLDLSQSIPFGNGQQASATAYVEQQHPLRFGEPEATLWGLRTNYQHVFASNNAVGLSLETQVLDADVPTSTYRYSEVRLTYGLAKPILTLGLAFHAALSFKTYDEFSISLNGRRDRRTELGVTAVFNQVSFFGFSPSISAIAHDTKSNVGLYQTRGTSIKFGFRSRF